MENQELLNNEGILTDEQVDQLVEVLESERKPIPSVSDTSDEKVELVEAEADVKIDPKTGTYILINDKDNELADKKISDKSLTDIATTESNDSEIEQGYLSDLLGSPEDAMQLYAVMNRVRAGEKFSVYNAIPESVKNMVKNITGTNNVQVLQEASAAVVDSLISDMESEKELIDFNKSFEKELHDTLGDMSDLYSSVVSDRCKQLQDNIKELEEKGEKEKAKILKDLLDAFNDSQSLVRQFDALDNMPGIRKALKRATKPGYLQKAIDQFNYKYKIRKNAKLVIKDISNLPMILLRILNKYVEDRSFTMDEVYQYTMLLCEVCKNYEPDNPVEHQFMYYSVNNIVALDYVSIEKSEFNKELIQNIVKVIDKIHEVVEEDQK